MKEDYSVDFFLNFFGAIPEDMWCEGTIVHGDRYCALGHCGAAVCTHTAATNALGTLLWPLTNLNREPVSRDEQWVAVGHINDGYNLRYPQPTPKLRILQALHDIKQLQEQQTASALDAYELRPLNLTKPIRKEAIEAIN